MTRKTSNKKMREKVYASGMKAGKDMVHGVYNGFTFDERVHYTLKSAPPVEGLSLPDPLIDAAVELYRNAPSDDHRYSILVALMQEQQTDTMSADAEGPL